MIKKRKVGNMESLIQFCSCMTIIVGVLLYFQDYLLELSIFLEVFFILLFGIGAIGLYLIVGNQIRKSFDWLEEEKKENK